MIATRMPVIALAGNPNAGKTTIFNRLTGARQKVGNYPGVTVERIEGSLRVGDSRVRVVDLPGIYSLSVWSVDELVARRFITEEAPDLIVNVVDASNLQRNLYLTMNLLRMQRPMIVVLNMMDVATRHALQIDMDALSEQLGVPVLPMVGPRVDGYAALIDRIGRMLASSPAPVASTPAPPVATEDGSRQAIHQAEADYERIADILAHSVQNRMPERRSTTEKIDAVICHRWLGLPVALGVLWLTFALTFRIADGWAWIPWPGGWRTPTGVVEGLFSEFPTWALSGMPEGPLKSLLLDGVVAGVGGVLGFMPLVFVLFFMLAIIEDSGYIARIAYVLDRILRSFGLQGRSIMAIIVSGGIAGGCAVPGVMATRTLSDPRDRLATMLVVPLLNCGAKLPVYAILIAAFFPAHRGTMLLTLTLVSWSVMLGVAWLLRRTVARGEAPPFVMELPTYHLVSPRNLLRNAMHRSWLYVRKAGTLILAVSIVVWAVMYFPRADVSHIDDPATAAQTQLGQSLAGRLGHALTPITKCAGFDWRDNIALISGVAAKEVVVSTLGTAYSLGEVDLPESDGATEHPLAQRLRQARGWSPERALALMIFVMFYSPCMVTLSVLSRESGSWKWAAFSTVWNTVLAFTLAVLVYQIGHLILA